MEVAVTPSADVLLCESSGSSRLTKRSSRFAMSSEISIELSPSATPSSRVVSVPSECDSGATSRAVSRLVFAQLNSVAEPSSEEVFSSKSTVSIGSTTTSASSSCAEAALTSSDAVSILNGLISVSKIGVGSGCASTSTSPTIRASSAATSSPRSISPSGNSISEPGPNSVRFVSTTEALPAKPGSISTDSPAIGSVPLSAPLLSEVMSLTPTSSALVSLTAAFAAPSKDSPGAASARPE